jgi:hypothetical protein
LSAFSQNGFQQENLRQRLENQRADINRTLEMHTFLKSIGLIAGFAYGDAGGEEETW